MPTLGKLKGPSLQSASPMNRHRHGVAKRATEHGGGRVDPGGTFPIHPLTGLSHHGNPLQLGFQTWGPEEIAPGAAPALRISRSGH